MPQDGNLKSPPRSTLSPKVREEILEAYQRYDTALRHTRTEANDATLGSLHHYREELRSAFWDNREALRTLVIDAGK